MFNALEIDFIGVGKGSARSGDAIAMRFGNCENGIWNSQFVIIIDGGDVQAGRNLVKLVKETYNTDDVAICILTHPDADHASGLRKVLNDLNVGNLWMHRPWHYWDDFKESIKDGRVTKKSFNERLKEAYQFAYELEEIALEREINIVHPHQGTYASYDDEPILTILGPGKELYKSLIEASDKTPRMSSRLGAISGLLEEEGAVFESMDFSTEHLSDENETTSAENDMSLILHLTVANTRVLFTADAGTMGMYRAIAYALENNIDLKKLNFFQVPHHGSRHNISKGILKYIYAPKAMISCAENGVPNHPAAVVTNALLRRQITPFNTNGNDVLWSFGMAPGRPGHTSMGAIPFQPWVDL